MNNIINLKSQVFSTVYNWCIDNNLTPFILVCVSEETKGLEAFKDTKILSLRLSVNSIINLNIFDTCIEFETRFNKVSTKVIIPLGNIAAVYPEEHPDYGIHFATDIDNKQYLQKDNILNNDIISTEKKETAVVRKPKSFLSVVK